MANEPRPPADTILSNIITVDLASLTTLVGLYCIWICEMYANKLLSVFSIILCGTI